MPTEASLFDAGQRPRMLRYSVSLVRQGRHQFYTLTMPSDVLARTCKVTTRNEDPTLGFQRELDQKRATEIATYIDNDFGTIPNSIVLSAQPEAELRVIGRRKTIEFADRPGAFLVLDGQHRVYGFSKAKTQLRVPVVIYNNLSRVDETRLFIDINTKQRPVPAQLLLDIKKLAQIESESESRLRAIFDLFNTRTGSALGGMMAPHESVKNKITRVTFNAAVKPLLESFGERDPEDVYEILNNYLTAVAATARTRTTEFILARPVIFRAFMGLFPNVAQRVQDKFSGKYTSGNFADVMEPLFAYLPAKKLKAPGSSWVNLRDYLASRLRGKMAL